MKLSNQSLLISALYRYVWECGKTNFFIEMKLAFSCVFVDTFNTSGVAFMQVTRKAITRGIGALFCSAQ